MHILPMEYLRAANLAEGGHFFSTDAMRAFDSRIESKEAFYNVHTQDAFFVTSECMSPGALRLYKVRRFDEACRVHTVSDKPFVDLASAIESARRLASAH